MCVEPGFKTRHTPQTGLSSCWSNSGRVTAVPLIRRNVNVSPFGGPYDGRIDSRVLVLQRGACGWYKPLCPEQGFSAPLPPFPSNPHTHTNTGAVCHTIIFPKWRASLPSLWAQYGQQTITELTSRLRRCSPVDRLTPGLKFTELKADAASTRLWVSSGYFLVRHLYLHTHRLCAHIQATASLDGSVCLLSMLGLSCSHRWVSGLHKMERFA